MSDHSTGSSSSSTNSWTLLSPEEAASDTAGPLDDGTESTGDVPSLSEEVAGISLEVKPSDAEAAPETVLSEEGHQVCQETSPEFFEEGAGLSAEADPEICAPVIHATITTSSSDNDLLEAVPFSIATESSHFLSAELFIEPSYEESDVQPTSDFSSKPCRLPETDKIPASVERIGPGPEPVDEIGPESSANIGRALEVTAEESPFPDLPESFLPDDPADVSLASDSQTSVSDIHTGVSSHPPSPSSEMNVSFAAESPYPESPARSVLEEKEPITDTEKRTSVHVARETESLGTDVPVEQRGADAGLRQRRVHYHEELRQSSDEEDGEETEFRIPPAAKEEKPGLSISHVIIAALALLCLSSFYFSSMVLDPADDFDGSDLSDQELLDKLVEENKQISILEAQIQTQKEELDRALRAAAERGFTDEEHSRMKEELSALPSLKEELEALKARVSELTQLTGGENSELSSGFSKEAQVVPDKRWGKRDELKRQKILLDQSKTRLEGLKKQNWPKKWLGERLVEMQQRLVEQVEHMGKKDDRRRKHKEEEDRKNGKGCDGVQRHKELMKKYHDELEQGKAERRLKREKRKQEKSWQARPGNKQKHNHPVHQHRESKDFWKLQEKKLRRNQNPPEHCHGVSGCAQAEGLVRVKLSDFQGLLDIYLNKLRELSVENKEAFHYLVAQFFHSGVFSHDKVLFSEFVEDVADILEDLADVLIDDDVLEKEMEAFEREALWHFAAKCIKS